MANPKPLARLLPDGSLGVILTEPMQCACGRMAMLVVNRYGKTRCLECDEKAKAERDGK